jgi:putative transposase
MVPEVPKEGIRWDVTDRLKELIRQIIIDHQSGLIELEVRPDHVHLLLEVDPQ